LGVRVVARLSDQQYEREAMTAEVASKEVEREEVAREEVAREKVAAPEGTQWQEVCLGV